MLLDTSGLLCLHHKGETFHELACAEYRKSTVRITHDYVLAEFVALASARGLPREPALLFVRDLIDNPDIHVTWVEPSLCSEALNLLFARLDKGYSLCDAVSFVLMRRHTIQDNLTTDRHFQQEGFRRLLVSS